MRIAFFTSFIDVQDRMPDVTRLFENPVEATTIVKKFVLLLDKKKKMKKKMKKKNEKKKKKKNGEQKNIKD